MFDAMFNILSDPMLVLSFALTVFFVGVAYIGRWFIYIEDLREKRGLKNA